MGIRRTLATIAAAAVALTCATIPSVAAAPAPFKNCAAFNAKYPVGVAKTTTAALAATARGKERPAVNKRVFASAISSNPNLGGPKDGVLCEVPVRITIPTEVQSLSVQTPTLTSPQTTVFLSWLPPASDGKSPITAYEISDGTQVLQSSLPGPNGVLTAYTLTGLTAGTAYTFTVAAINAAGAGPRVPVAGTTAPVPAPVATPIPTPVTASRYATCAAARAAGVTPLHAGTAVYDANRHLDRDGDGIACE